MSNGNEITEENLNEKIFDAASKEFGSRVDSIREFLKTESQKIAITIRMIIEGRANGAISEEEAKILLNMQATASKSVLTAAEGMSILAVEGAINAALGVIRDFVNGKAGFQLL